MHETLQHFIYILLIVKPKPFVNDHYSLIVLSQVACQLIFSVDRNVNTLLTRRTNGQCADEVKRRSNKYKQHIPIVPYSKSYRIFVVSGHWMVMGQWVLVIWTRLWGEVRKGGGVDYLVISMCFALMSFKSMLQWTRKLLKISSCCRNNNSIIYYFFVNL